jgi:hypothetical protein
LPGETLHEGVLALLGAEFSLIGLAAVGWSGH